MNDTQMTTAMREASEIATVPESNSAALMLMAERLASNPEANVDKLKQILDIAREARREEAEAAFNEAMTAAQIEMGRIAANKDNAQTKSKYADYAQLDRALRPIYTKHGFALSFDCVPLSEGMVTVVAHVSRGGFSRDYNSAPMPTDGKGPQGAAVMTRTHAAGAAMTYGMRYLLKMIFNVAIGEDDTDGNMPGDTITEDQADEIKSVLEKGAEISGNYAGWLTRMLKFAKVQGLNDIPAKDFGKILAAAKKAVSDAEKGK